MRIWMLLTVLANRCLVFSMAETFVSNFLDNNYPEDTFLEDQLIKDKKADSAGTQVVHRSDVDRNFIRHRRGGSERNNLLPQLSENHPEPEDLDDFIEEYVPYERLPYEYHPYSYYLSKHQPFAYQTSNLRTIRMPNNNNFLRFGRGRSNDFIRFGRGRSSDFIRFGRDPSGNDYPIFPEDIPKGVILKDVILRDPRGSVDGFLRFGRSVSKNSSNIAPKNTVRLTRVRRNVDETYTSEKRNKNMLRFGRNKNFMRFGRPASDENDKEKFSVQSYPANMNILSLLKQLSAQLNQENKRREYSSL